MTWADIYDVLYGTESRSAAAGVNAALLAAQMAYLQRRLPPPPARVLDAGCGTGRHLLPLAQVGYRAVGVDVSDGMLHRAREVLTAAGVSAGLVRGDLRTLPFAGEFDAALCLESPLAYLHEDADLAAALGELRRCLVTGARLIVDVYDYPAALGEGSVAPVETYFATAWGSVTVRETHRYDRAGRFWHMTQAFTVDHAGQTDAFTEDIVLRIRSAAEYVAALERAGFVIEELLPAYPNLPPALADEQRILIVGKAI